MAETATSNILQVHFHHRHVTNLDSYRQLKLDQQLIWNLAPEINQPWQTRMMPSDDDMYIKKVVKVSTW